MRPDPFDQQPEWGRLRYNHAPADPPPAPIADRPGLTGFGDWHGVDSGSGSGTPPVQPAHPRRRWGRWIMRGFGSAIILFIIIVAWLAVTAPLSRSLKPPTPPSITLTAEDGTPIARRGAIIGAPVDAAKLPAHVREAFLAIEDRRFYSHWGVDPRGIARAAWHNMRGGGVREGGSTITQQLAKNAFLDSDRTAARKIREAMISFWLEAWLTKDEILSRYLSNVYFGDNVYGIRAASRHYFGRTPEDLNIGQAAMLAGLVKAPSRLAPTGNLAGARAREAVVVGAMVDAGFLTKAEAARVQPQRVRHDDVEQLPNGTYFADWVLPSARDQAGEIKTETTVQTTLDRKMQRAAERAVKRAGLKQAQVALVAMRPDGRVVAMVGGKDYGKSPFNRATQARRQPGSTFKLFVYLAAMRAGMTPDSTVEDRPIEISGWKPKNSDGQYRGTITLREAFARSSNVAAARLTQQVGVRAVIKAARDLGISTPIPEEATIALGTSTVSLLELTAAYGAIARGSYPVAPRGLEQVQDKSWYENFTSRPTTIPDDIRAKMLDLMSASVSGGTSRQAGLSVDTFGKTGTTQDNRDALFMGFANGIVAGVWVGNDDNTPNPGLSGGGIPARIWRDFMTQALGLEPATRPAAIPADDEYQGDDVGNLIDQGVGDIVNGQIAPIQGQLEGMGLNLKMGEDGSITVGPSRGRDEPPPRDRREDRRAPDEDSVYDQQ
ncbi:Penicillin-binding protein [Sphingomonas sp. EC-HK361]|uniref:transglycosylase domain-containing protein n=1 Tax=Sphingomonas sp. EC-HK361 TaxID=2038397 RepID=UPI00125299D1|nr:transglycosylase domain-containing protein [Sphingomonas sp. EC-HK361]VVT11017.1 Penicillin-binding protein [Sphingomonas sp. EC-HK361]